jgi:hypothetical protein
VRKPLKDVRLTVRQGENVVLSQKYRKALPAEMIQVKLPVEKLSEQADLEVSVE